MAALITVGVAMSYAGNSRPASGSEHHLSHFFELTGIERRRPYLLHGIDVGYATVMTCRMREQALRGRPITAPWFGTPPPGRRLSDGCSAPARRKSAACRPGGWRSGICVPW